ncbi:hypothetical protein ACFOX0_18985 [Micromonospora zhanjiangensis]|uniref:Uncharacterized protein n=1 Tax=Micromonospora zhanjiangensis TaxID=1522057 RepID=A0ABV8KPM3_9ACTN
MAEQELDLPEWISNSTLRRVQRSLDEDFRVAIDNNRADRSSGRRRLPGGLKVPNTRQATRKARANTAALVDGRLREGWLGWARIAGNWFMRQARRRRKPDEMALSDGHGRFPAIGAEQERWIGLLSRQHLSHDEQRSVGSAVAAAYLVSRNPELNTLYQKNPREMRNLAEIFGEADRIANAYEPRAGSRPDAASARFAGSGEVWQTTFEPRQVSVAPGPGMGRGTVDQMHTAFYPPPPYLPSASYSQPSPPPPSGNGSAPDPARRTAEPTPEELERMLPRQRDALVPPESPEQARRSFRRRMEILSAAQMTPAGWDGTVPAPRGMPSTNPFRSPHRPAPGGPGQAPGRGPSR